ALVRNLVELHGGKVACASAGLGKGSTFTVRLPLAPSAAAQAPQRGTLMNGGERLTLLVVDDNIDAANMLAMLLKALG
ncbi:hypothetical protein AAAB32_10055, partial [Lactobacillus acidophilus]|uniref:hypothetical protein n=1 Tax=Lactobacillus acidophilus TaxID=1579 RepID=UPI0030F0F2AD